VYLPHENNARSTPLKKKLEENISVSRISQDGKLHSQEGHLTYIIRILYVNRNNTVYIAAAGNDVAE
jgi:hypothetical protein